MTNKILYTHFISYHEADFDNVEPIRITADELLEEILKFKDREIYLGKIIVEGNFSFGCVTFKRNFFCGQATFEGDFFCGEATFERNFYGDRATFKRNFRCGSATFKGYFSFGKATFEGGKPNIPSGVKQKKTEEITNKNIDNAKLDSVVGLININTLQELVYAEVAMMEYDGDIHPAVYGHRLLLKAFFKAGDIPAKFYEIIRSKLNDNKTWSFILARIFTELKSELINYD